MAFEKTVLEGGSDIYLPNKLSNVVVDVTGKWCTSDGDDVVFDLRQNATMELDHANDELDQAIEDMLFTMKHGERSRFLLHDGYRLLTHSRNIGHDHIPPMGAEVTFTICLHSFHRGREIWDLTDQERLEIAKRHKEQGSVLFKEGHFRGASMCYSKCVQYLAAVDPDTPFEVESLEDYEREILSLRTVALMNLAACQLKFDQYDGVVRNCSKVLEWDPRNIKSWYRRAKALLGMNDFESARTDLLKAKELDPSNQAVAELLRTVEVQEAAHRAKYKDALKVMFS